MKSLLTVIALLTGLVWLASCRKDRFTTSGNAYLRSSVDTLHFDTVFTTTGSTSGVVKIFNDDKDGIRISSVRLAGGAASPFKINVDGLPGPEVRDLELAGQDSLYIFVTVTVQPNAINQPFIVQDSIAVNWNGNTRWIQLDAFGQNARFLRNQKIQGSVTWDKTLPYVILGGVTVDTTATLTITEGTRVYFHADAPLLVHGRLLVNGDRYDSTRVLFTGDRRDDPYRDFPASWPGLVFTRAGTGSILNYAVVRNAYQGIVVEGPATATQVALRQCIIDNAYDAGILGSNARIDATNLLVSNCGSNIVLAGGSYQFDHVTGVAYGNSFVQHKDPVLFVGDVGFSGTSNALSASFRNCIFWGEANGIVNNEVVVGRQGSAAFNLVFDKVLWRVRNTPSPATINGALNNQDPRFDSVDGAHRYYDFRLQGGSPAIDKGAPTSTAIDLDGKPRPVSIAPDLGAYERQ